MLNQVSQRPKSVVLWAGSIFFYIRLIIRENGGRLLLSTTHSV